MAKPAFPSPNAVNRAIDRAKLYNAPTVDAMVATIETIMRDPSQGRRFLMNHSKLVFKISSLEFQRPDITVLEIRELRKRLVRCGWQLKISRPDNGANPKEVIYTIAESTVIDP